jgi:hypothetical membrane protein
LKTKTVSSHKGSREPVPAFAWLLAVCAGIAYGSWVLQFVVNPQLDPVNGYVSELSATDQPYHYLFAAGDFVSGLLTIIVVVIVLRSVRPRGYALVGWLALVVFGVFSIGDSLFAMDCAPNSDTTCALRERAGKVSFAHQFHSVTSACVVTAGIVSLIALTIAARRSRRRTVIARWSWLLLLVETPAALATLPLMYFGVLLGVIERVQVAMISLWLFVIAGQLYADRHRPSRTREPTGPAGHRVRPGPAPYGPARTRPELSPPTPPAREPGPDAKAGPATSRRPTPRTETPAHATPPGSSRSVEPATPAPGVREEPSAPQRRGAARKRAAADRGVQRGGPDDGAWEEAART